TLKLLGTYMLNLIQTCCPRVSLEGKVTVPPHSPHPSAPWLMPILQLCEPVPTWSREYTVLLNEDEKPLLPSDTLLPTVPPSQSIFFVQALAHRGERSRLAASAYIAVLLNIDFMECLSKIDHKHRAARNCNNEMSKAQCRKACC